MIDEYAYEHGIRKNGDKAQCEAWRLILDFADNLFGHSEEKHQLVLNRINYD